MALSDAEIREALAVCEGYSVRDAASLRDEVSDANPILVRGERRKCWFRSARAHYAEVLQALLETRAEIERLRQQDANATVILVAQQERIAELEQALGQPETDAGTSPSTSTPAGVPSPGGRPEHAGSTLRFARPKPREEVCGCAFCRYVEDSL